VTALFVTLFRDTKCDILSLVVVHSEASSETTCVRQQGRFIHLFDRLVFVRSEERAEVFG